MSLKTRLDDFERRMQAVAAAMAREGRLLPAFVVVNDPEAGLDGYRLPAEVVEKLGTIKVGRPEPGGEPESAREWVARLSLEAASHAV
jgi:hypothetical protein